MELAWVIGVLTMAAGVACVSASNFGYSMIVAPAYLLFARLGGAITFGTAEYILQGFLLLVMCLAVRRFTWRYLWAFATAVIYGYTFDGMLWIVGKLGIAGLGARIAAFAVGTMFISISVALFVRTYIAPEVYELFVKELARVYRIEFGKVKFCYDCTSCTVSIILSVLMFGWGAFEHFTAAGFGKAVLDGYILEGIGIGTIAAALVNGPLITLCGKWLDRRFAFTKNEKIAKWF